MEEAHGLGGWSWAEPTPEAATSTILAGFCFLLGVVCELLRALVLQSPPIPALPPQQLAPSATDLARTEPAARSVSAHPRRGSTPSAATCPLAAEFPAVHPAERLRFIVARNGDANLAAELLRKHLAWRAANLSLPRPLALSASLPEFVRVHPIRARDGTRIVIHRPCTIDLTVGCSEDYVVALAGFLDSLLDRGAAEKLTVLIDCRPLPGAPNVPVTKLLPLIQKMSKTLSEQFPERLENLLVYPVPVALSFILGLVRPFLVPKTADKIRLLSGPAREDSPCPVKLAEIVSLEAFREADRLGHATLGQYQKPV